MVALTISTKILWIMARYNPWLCCQSMLKQTARLKMSVDLSVKKARIVSMNNVNKEAVQRIFNAYQSYKILYQGHKTSYIILFLFYQN